MQVRRVAVVATGALATAAAIGSTPAFAADGGSSPEVAPATVGTLQYEGKHRASDEAMRQLAEQWMAVAPEQTWTAPWEAEPRQILSVGSGSAVSLAPWQQCASGGPFLAGGSAPMASPATVVGSCSNGQVDGNGGSGDDALFSVLDDSVVSALAYQQCGSGVGGAGASVPVASPSTVGGNCDNGGVSVGEPEQELPDPYEAGTMEAGQSGAAAAPEQVMVAEQPWDQDDVQILAAGNGSATSAGAWQQCGSSGPFIAGGSAPQDSPNTVLGRCSNGMLDIHGEPSDALYTVLDGAGISAVPFQQCGSGVGGAGLGAPVASPSTVARSCDNGGVTVG